MIDVRNNPTQTGLRFRWLHLRMANSLGKLVAGARRLLSAPTSGGKTIRLTIKPTRLECFWFDADFALGWCVPPGNWGEIQDNCLQELHNKRQKPGLFWSEALSRGWIDEIFTAQWARKGVGLSDEFVDEPKTSDEWIYCYRCSFQIFFSCNVSEDYWNTVEDCAISRII